MSKRTSEDLSNTIEVADPNSVEGGGDEEEVFEGSEFDSAADETPAVGVQELGQGTFRVCTSLRVMKVPDSLQTFGGNVFYLCSKLVPSDIDDGDSNAVIAYLRSMQ
ncbi:hypothetical protein TrVE_jg2390 [Triparma verrucosa]|uniref:Uncharacterized protein n=1 Tax=Triparma verrucosa TaxID=1606542 RepID=A0A9W7BHJ7_9STRA|nr:hypothetical protein TrVE_jg2390 [Triparma verrucosa]